MSAVPGPPPVPAAAPRPSPEPARPPESPPSPGTGVIQRRGGGGGPRKGASHRAGSGSPGPSPPALGKRRKPDGGPPSDAFDAKKLSDGQLDELTHRLVGPLTRLLRTELRLDRERVGKLRDPRR
ncbi:hypothetical protein E0L36_09375 [Streptomyces sp. AJS327]|uniref:hypothetical protein n=1 Tax=Streptomyces sp. AJS327 TaxID=2545265 RepID=UPI0015E01DEA|nr:hypothetical protein [Streptomyces sp. AJS327]MBA0051095.1 hypothetical protein [Streptomyces sp. AJS327]